VEDITWFDPAGRYPDWNNEANTLGCVIHGRRFDDAELCLLFNARLHAVEFQLPPVAIRPDLGVGGEHGRTLTSRCAFTGGLQAVRAVTTDFDGSQYGGPGAIIARI